MRAKQSSTAIGMYSRSGTLTPAIPPPILAASVARTQRKTRSGKFPQGAGTVTTASGGLSSRLSSVLEVDQSPATRRSRGGATQRGRVRPAQGRGLAHDALNLLNALGLYSDLLSQPGVLRPEHRHYAEELRIVGRRSTALMERLMLSADPAARMSGLHEEEDPERRFSSPTDASVATAAPRYPEEAGSGPGGAVALRTILDRCSGLLSRVAGGAPVEVSYATGASTPVRVSEEAVLRILINLVSNAAAALTRSAGSHVSHISPVSPELPGSLSSAAHPPGRIGAVTIRENCDGTEDETPGAIRIGVGLAAHRGAAPAGGAVPRVRLWVEDSGCGMTREQLAGLLDGQGTPLHGGHGIGLQVVRELVDGSGGVLTAMSFPGVGTRVQIEWLPEGGRGSWGPRSPGLYLGKDEGWMPC
jgi:signal transduction histidine kinase